METAKKQAIHDMSEAGIRTSVLYMEKEILQITATSENQRRPDFRKYNGGTYNKSKLLKKQKYVVESYFII